MRTRRARAAARVREAASADLGSHELGIPLLLALLYGVNIAVVFDLGEAQRGIVRASEQALTDLQRIVRQPR